MISLTAEDEAMWELLGEIKKIEEEREEDRERLHNMETDKPIDKRKFRDISTATLRNAAANATGTRRKYKAAISLQRIFDMYAVNYHQRYLSSNRCSTNLRGSVLTWGPTNSC